MSTTLKAIIPEEYRDTTQFPIAGLSGVIYRAIDANKLYTWHPAELKYVEVAPVNRVMGMPPFMFAVGDKVTHQKTQMTYVIEFLPDEFMLEATNEPAYGYRAVGGTRVWVRSQLEMEDGRFAKVD